MNRLLKLLVSVSLLGVILLLGVLPVVFVSAQRFSQTNAAGETTHFFDELIVEERVQNDSFLLAYEDYKVAVNQFVLHDINDDASVGSSVDEVNDNFEASVEGQYVELTDSETYLSYMYYVEDVQQAELLLYFVDSELYYIGLTNLQVDIDISEFVADERMQGWIDDEISIDALVNEPFRVTGVSQVLYDELPYHMVMIPTGDSETALDIDYTIFNGDSVFESYMLDFYYSFEAPQDNMIQYFAYFLGVSQEYPVAE